MAERNITSSSPTAPDLVASNQVLAYFTLAEDYGLSQDMYFATPNNSDQTVEEEFSSYASGSLSLQGTNMLQFWEVRTYSTTRHYAKFYIIDYSM
jgi:hypothetical protein